MRQLKGIVFDLDGTLIDSMPDLYHALNSTLAAHGRRSVTLDEFKTFYGDGMRFIVQRAFAATGAPYDDTETHKYFQEYLHYYRHQPHDPSQTYPHVTDMLEMLKKAKVRIGICSLKPEAAALSLLDELELRKYFDAVAGGDTFEVCKPHGGHLLGVIERLGVAVENCLMVGDRLKDVTMAHEAGVPCILVDHDGSCKEEISAEGIMHGFDDFTRTLATVGFKFCV